MEMIDRYIYAVTQKLPEEQRKDIAIELRGLIEDMLEERTGAKHQTEKDVEEVLLELGNPRELADKYRGTKRYLIGPELFDAYILVLKIVLIVVAAVIGVEFLIKIIINPFNILDDFIEVIVSLVTALPTAFGWTTFGFVMGELYGGVKKEDFLGTKWKWKPSDLPSIPDEKRRIKRGESIVGIVFYAAILVLLSFSSDYFGVWAMRDGLSGVVPFLNEQTYGTYLLFIIFIFGSGILKESLKIVTGKWTYKLAVFTTIINAISMIAVLLMITGPDFWNPNFMSELAETGIVKVGSDAYQVINKIWDRVTLWIFVLMIVGLVLDAIAGFVKARKR